MLILGFVLALVLLLSATLNKTYYHLPLKELKRRARTGDTLAKALYKPAAYGMELRLVLGAVSVLSASASFVILSLNLANWLAFIVAVLLLWAAFFWLPTTRQTAFSNFWAKLFAPILAKLLHYLHRPLKPISRLVHNYYPFNAHTGIYAKQDLVDLIHWQAEQKDNQIPLDELNIAANALGFSDKLVRDILVPTRMVRSVAEGETISPILIDELHKTGHSRFPVYEGKKDNIVGTLYVTDLLSAAKKGGLVSGITKRDVRYVHEDFSLHELLDAYLATRQHIFVVVNNFEEFVGIVTVEDLVAQILGRRIAGEFNEYENPRAVAELKAKKEHERKREADIELTEEHLHGPKEEGEIDSSETSG